MLYREELVKVNIEKSDLALKAAKDNIKLSNLETAQNRVYYAIFYIVTALSYKYDFITSKHKQLMGWFNKKFIYEEKVFDEELLEIYKRSFEKRTEGDYKPVFLTNKEDVEDSYKEAILFVNKVKAFLN